MIYFEPPRFIAGYCLEDYERDFILGKGKRQMTLALLRDPVSFVILFCRPLRRMQPDPLDRAPYSPVSMTVL